MNKFSFSNKLKYYLAVSATLLISALFVVIFVGFNKSIEYGGGAELTVTAQSKTELAQVEKLVKKVLKENNVKIDSLIHENNGAEFSVVFQTKNKNVKETVSTQVTEKIANFENIKSTGFENIGSTYRIDLWRIIVSFAVLLTIFSIAAKFRYSSWLKALAVVVSTIHAFAIGLAVFAIARIEMMTATTIILAVGSIFATVLTFETFERIKSERKLLANQNKTEFELTDEAETKNFKTNWIFIAAICVVAIALMVICSKTTMFAAVGIFAMTAVAIFSEIVASSFAATLSTVFAAKRQTKMMKNEAVSIEKPTKKEKFKKLKRPEKVEQKPEQKKKKRKRRNASTKDENKIVV